MMVVNRLNPTREEAIAAQAGETKKITTTNPQKCWDLFFWRRWGGEGGGGGGEGAVSQW
jgi:hypothetical protein